MSFFQASIAFTHACNASGEGAKHSSEMKGSNCATVRYRIQSIGRCTLRYLYLYHTVLTKAVYSLFFNYQSYLNLSAMYISTNDALNIRLFISGVAVTGLCRLTQTSRSMIDRKIIMLWPQMTCILFYLHIC